MFGLLKNISKSNGKNFLYTVLGNDGQKYFYKCDQSSRSALVKDLKINERVIFQIRNGKQISHLNRPTSDSKEGRVIHTMSDSSGLIELSTGETVEYKDAVLEPYQKVTAIPAPVLGDDSRFAGCSDLKPVYSDALTDDICTEVSKILRNEFKEDNIKLFDDVINCLEKYDISMKRFGYSNKLHFLEQFPLVLRLLAEKEKAIIIKEDEIAPQYEIACEILKKQGYNSQTLLQRRVFSDICFWNNNRTLILGSTSSGKTAVALTKYLYDYENSSEKQKLLIAVNLRTLTTQFQNVIQKRLKEHYDLTVAISTSEYTADDNDIRQGNFDIAIVIYEKMYIFSATEKNFFLRYTHLLLDEAAIVADNERGAKVDIILSKACSSPNLKITILGTPYYQWEQYIHGYDLYPIKIYSRPVPIHEFFLYPKQNEKNSNYYLFADSNARSIASKTIFSFEKTLFTICEEEYSANHKMLVFFFSQNETREYSKKLYHHFKKIFGWKDIPAQEIHSFIKAFIRQYSLSFEELKGYFDTDAEYEALYHGIAFHNASVPEKLRIAIETEFLGTPKVLKESLGLRIVFSTDTLAYGLNSNVDTVVISQMERFSVNRYDKISFNTYQNCIGRSGRLGYRTYGKSYTFFKPDFESKFFVSKSNLFVLPKNSILYYTNSSSDAANMLCGKLGRIIAEADTDQLAFYVLSLFIEDKSYTTDDILTYLKNIPKPNGFDETALNEIIDRVLDLLLNNDMICYRDNGFDILNESDTKGYYLTMRGKQFQGYAIRIESFKKLYSILKILIHDDDLYVFDYFLALVDIKEFSDIIPNILTTYEQAEKNMKNTYNIDQNMSEKNIAERQIEATFVLINKMLPVFLEKHWISKSKYDTIIQFMEKAKNWLKLSEKKFYELLSYRAATIITMWISGYNIKMISELQGIEEQKIDNIRRKFGEKVSYYTDIMCTVAKNQKYAPEIIQKITQLSISLFYGICYDWVIKDNLLAISVERANSYHIASMCAARYEMLKALKDEEHLKTLREEFRMLDPVIINIMRNKGVEFNE